MNNVDVAQTVWQPFKNSPNAERLRTHDGVSNSMVYGGGVKRSPVAHQGDPPLHVSKVSKLSVTNDADREIGENEEVLAIVTSNKSFVLRGAASKGGGAQEWEQRDGDCIHHRQFDAYFGGAEHFSVYYPNNGSTPGVHNAISCATFKNTRVVASCIGVVEHVKVFNHGKHLLLGRMSRKVCKSSQTWSELSIIDTASGDVVLADMQVPHAITGVTASSTANRVVVWDLKGVMTEITAGTWDSQTMYVEGDGWGNVASYDTRNDRFPTSRQQEDGCWSLCCMSPCGDMVFFAGDDDAVTLFTTHPERRQLWLDVIRRRVPDRAAVASVAFAAAGSRLVCCGNDNRIFILDSRSGADVFSWCAAFSVLPQMLTVSDHANTFVWKDREGKVCGAGEDASFSSLHSTADFTIVCIGDGGEVARLQSLCEYGAVAFCWEIALTIVPANVAVSADGHLLIVVSASGEVRHILTSSGFTIGNSHINASPLAVAFSRAAAAVPDATLAVAPTSAVSAVADAEEAVAKTTASSAPAIGSSGAVAAKTDNTHGPKSSTPSCGDDDCEICSGSLLKQYYPLQSKETTRIIKNVNAQFAHAMLDRDALGVCPLTTDVKQGKAVSVHMLDCGDPLFHFLCKDGSCFYTHDVEVESREVLES